MRTLTITLKSAKPGCPPLSCGKGAPIAMELKSASVNKGADGSGWLVGVIAENPKSVCPIGASDWVYVINFPDNEFSSEFIAGLLDELVPADMNTGEGAIGLCCMNCGHLMLLDKIKSDVALNNLKRESFRIYADSEPIQIGATRLFRMNNPILITSIEISVEQNLVGYPYATEIFPVKASVSASPEQQTGPANLLSALEAIIDPASSSPLTGRVDFVPPLSVPSGAGVWININSDDPEAHLGFEVHVDFSVQPTE